MSSQSSLRSYVLRRCLQVVPTLLFVIVLNFTLIHVAPGDPAIILAGEGGGSSGSGLGTDVIDKLRHDFGLDKPIEEQLAIYLWKIVSGDFGYSILYRQPVLTLVMSVLPATLLLTGLSLVFATVIAILMGAYAASKVYSKSDNAITTISLMGYSLPVFWFAQVLLVVLALDLGLFPVQGMFDMRVSSEGFAMVGDLLYHLFLPAVALSAWQIGMTVRLTRASMLEILGEDYIVTARSKGLHEGAIVYKHALRNAMLPVVTITGMNAGLTLSGAVLTETVFAWPGIGRLMYSAINMRDYPVIMGIFIVTSVVVIFANLITDIMYGFLDPRIRYK